jgi:predicted phosphate transport protein (TIGR00153 family)
LKPLESWLKSRRKVQAITMIGDQSKDTVMAIEELERCISYAIQGQTDDMLRSFNVLSLKEKEAGFLKKKIIAELSKGDLPSNEREDLMRLARAVDQVIDWINETGRILVEFDLNRMPEEIKNIILDMIRIVKSTVIRLEVCVEKLISRKFDDALEEADRVERLEEEMDDLYKQGRGALNRIKSSDIEIGPAILLAQFIDAMENVTDRCEETIDEVRTISVSMRF